MAKSFTISLDEDQSSWLDSLLLDFVSFELEKTTTSSTQSSFLASVAGQPAGTQALFATRALDGEVENGGFKQFFWNTSGTQEGLHEAARSGMRVIGAMEHLAVFEKAYQLIKPHLARIRELADLDLSFDRSQFEYELELQGDGTERKLHALDTEFFAIRPTLAQARLIFAANNPHLCRVMAQEPSELQTQTT